MRVRARLRVVGRLEARELVHGDLRLDLRARRVVTPNMGEHELSNRESRCWRR